MLPVLDPMPASQRRNRIPWLVFGTGATIGLHLGFLHLVILRTAARQPPASAAAVPFTLLSFVAGGLVFATAIYGLWRWVFPHLGGRSFASQLARQAAVSTVAIGLVSLAIMEVVTLVFGLPSLFGTPTGVDRTVLVTPAMRQMGLRLYVVLPIVPTVLLGLISYHQYWLQLLTLQHRERELTELAATAQLAALRAQINPHFLFNSLNSIAQLIHADPEKAEACVERLADIFRYILRRAEQEFVPLGDELQMAEAYLEIERARFGDRLRVETAVDSRSRQQLVPNLILQPLVENAVKHGLSRKMGPGTVRIEARVNDGLLTLTVGDDGVGMPGPTLGRIYDTGVGLRNLRDRLARLYGPSHLPDIASAPGGGTRVRLLLPARSVEAAA